MSMKLLMNKTCMDFSVSYVFETGELKGSYTFFHWHRARFQIAET